MKRQIKFRAWYEDPFLPSRMETHEDLDTLDKDGIIHLFDIINGKHPEISLMQFTEQHDKNGKEIYECDILKHDSGVIYQYLWDDGQAEYYIADTSGAFLMYNGINNVNSLYSQQSEIIGNTYENPELCTPTL